jgi:hypothetical protein
MTQNHIAQCASAPAAAGEYAAPFTPEPVGEHSFASEEEEDAFWKGVSHGIRCAGREPGHPHMPVDFDLDLTRTGASASLVSGKLLEAAPPDGAASPAPRPPRHDGFTLDRVRIFLDTLAATGVVADACRAAGVSRVAAYDLRKRTSGRAFSLAWDAALLLARPRVSDEVMSRSIHGVIDRVYRNGELVAERHRYDNRLTMAVLTRLDRQAEAMGEGAATARTIAGEWDQFLDIVESGGEGAEAFLCARTPGAAAPEAAKEVESQASLLARLDSYNKYAAGLPQEIKTCDLDPAQMQCWSEEQWARADHSGLLDRLDPSDWPDAARTRGETDANGMCKVRKAYRARHDEADEDFAGCDVWEEEDGRWLTSFPPPAGFDGEEEGEPGAPDYQRTLTQEEIASLGSTEEDEEAERAALLAEQEAARRRFFGLGAAVSDAPAGHLAAEGHLAVVPEGGGGEVDLVAGGAELAGDLEAALGAFELVGAAPGDCDAAGFHDPASDGAILAHVAGEEADRVCGLRGGEADGLALDRAQGEFAQRPPIECRDAGRVADLPLAGAERSIPRRDEEERQRGCTSGVDQPHFDPPA